MITEIFRNILLGSAIPALGGFIYFYTTEPAPGKWYRRKFSRIWLSTPLGPAWFTQKVALLSLFLLIISTYLWGDWPGRRFLADVLFALLVGMFWTHLVLLRKTQKRNHPLEQRKREPKKAGNDELH